MADVGFLKAYMKRVDGGIQTLLHQFTVEGTFNKSISFLSLRVQFGTQLYEPWVSYYTRNYPIAPDWWPADDQVIMGVSGYEQDLKKWQKAFEDETGKKPAPYTPLPEVPMPKPPPEEPPTVAETVTTGLVSVAVIGAIGFGIYLIAQQKRARGKVVTVPVG